MRLFRFQVSYPASCLGKYLAKSLVWLAILTPFAEISAQAEVYPWVDMYASDIRITDDPQIEAQVRLNMIERAKKSIDISTWDQRTDAAIGQPILEALRRAADRGVKIRFLASWAGHILKDSLNFSGRFLAHPPTRVPIDFIIVGGTYMQYRGWAPLDGIHEKLFIVDNTYLLTTGRGHAGQYLTWLDTSFFIKGPLVDQAIEAFQKLWEVCTQAAGYESVPPPPQHLELDSAAEPLALSKTESTEVTEITEWIYKPRTIPSPMEELWEKMTHLGNPKWKARTLHSNLLEQLRNLSELEHSKPRYYSRKDRLEKIEDPVANELIRLISDPQTKSFKFYTLASILNPKVKTALIEAEKRGLNIEIFTNSRAAHKSIVPIGFPIGWYISLPDLDDLLQSGIIGYQLVQKTPESYDYLHRKLAIADGTVIFGSHNFNLASSTESDEVSFEIQGQEFADQALKLFETSITRNGEKLVPDEIHQERQSSNWDQWFSSYLENWY